MAISPRIITRGFGNGTFATTLAYVVRRGFTNAALPPLSSYTLVQILSTTVGRAVLIGATRGRVDLIAKQLVTPDFPYTFSLDFNNFIDGTTYPDGKVVIL